MPNQYAPEGKVWQCQACGKLSRDKYGNHPIDRRWDESCMLNAALVDDPRKGAQRPAPTVGGRYE